MIGSVLSDIIMFGSAALFLSQGVASLRMAGKGRESARMRWFGIDYRLRGVSYLLLALMLTGDGLLFHVHDGPLGVGALSMVFGATLMAAVLWGRWFWHFASPERLNARTPRQDEERAEARGSDRT